MDRHRRVPVVGQQGGCVAFEDYPPTVHVLRDLGIETVRSGHGPSVARLRVNPHLLGADGGVRAGVLAVLVDVVGGSTAVDALYPDRVVTADLSLQLVAPAVGPVVEARAAVVRRGRTTLVLEVDLVNLADDSIGDTSPGDASPGDAGDGRGEPVGWAVLSFAVLRRRPETRQPEAPGLGAGGTGAAPGYSRPERGGGRHRFEGAPLDRPILEALAITTVGGVAGRVSMPVVEYVHNSLGAVQGGVMALLGEVAGTAAVGGALGDADVAAVDLHVTYLALGRHGPITTTVDDAWPDDAWPGDGAAAGRGAPGGGGIAGGALVELMDDGLDERRNTVVSVVAVAR